MPGRHAGQGKDNKYFSRCTITRRRAARDRIRPLILLSLGRARLPANSPARNTQSNENTPHDHVNESLRPKHSHHFPVRVATLYAFVFMSHQMGSFVGVWTGGYLFDITGSYLSVWFITIALGQGASLIHIFVDDQPIERVAIAIEETQRA